MVWPSWKSSKKLPRLVLAGEVGLTNRLLTGFVMADHSHKSVRRTPDCDNGKLMRTCLACVVAEKAQRKSPRRMPHEKDHSLVGRDHHRPCLCPACTGGLC